MSHQCRGPKPASMLRTHMLPIASYRKHSTGCGNRTVTKASARTANMIMATAAWLRTGRQRYTDAHRREIRTLSSANFQDRLGVVLPYVDK